MNIEFREINKSNYDACVSLSVSKDQVDYVASNAYSLVQSFYEENIYTLAIYCDDIMVGFILYDLDEELKGWSFSRFMIDSKYQGRGLGSLALEKFLEYFNNKYPNQPLYTSAELENSIAISLYRKFGFKELEPFEYTYNEKTYRELRMVKEDW